MSDDSAAYIYFGIDWTFYLAPTEFHAYKVSLLSCAITILAVMIGLGCYAASSSPSMLGYTFENVVDLLSSIVVVWRFYIDNGGDVAGEGVVPGAARDQMDRKEKRASILIAMILFLLGVVVASVAIAHLAESESVTDQGLLMGISFPSFLVFGALAAVKWRMSDILKSPAFRKDAMCSAFGAILSLGVFVSAAAGSNSLDGIVAVVVAVICMWVGLRTLVKNAEENRNKWWKKEFWGSEGETRAEKDERLNSGMEMRDSAQRNTAAYDMSSNVI